MHKDNFIMDSPMESQEFIEQTASGEGEANGGSKVRIKEIKIVLRDIQAPWSSWPEVHPQSLCETCRPRRTRSQSAAEHDNKCKRGSRRKCCEELLKSWKAPTRRHRLPRHLRDFVVDSTVLHLIEFSDWYNRGRLARQWDLHPIRKGVPTRERSPIKGTMKRKRTCRKEHELHRKKTEGNRKRTQPTSISSTLLLKARKQKPRCADETTRTSHLESKHRGRPKKHTNAPQTVTGVLQNRGRPKQCKNALQTISTSVSNLVEPMNRCSPPKQKDGMTAPLSKSKHGVIPRKSQDAWQTMLVSSLTLANPKLRVRGRPKKCQDTSQTVCLPVTLSPLTELRHRGQSKKCKDDHRVAPDCATGAETKRLGRPKKSSQAQKTKSASVTSSPACKLHSRPKNSRVAPKGGATNTQSSSQSKTKSLGSENVKQSTKCFNRLRKRKSGLLSSKQDLLKSVEPNQLRLLPSVNPDFSIDDNDSCMINISEYLAQLGTYLEVTDCHDTTIVGNVNGPEEGSCDENNNVSTDPEILHQSGISDERTAFCMRLDPGDGSCGESGYQKTDANNNLITNTDIHKKSETGTRPSDSGDISDISCDTIQVSKSKRSKRTQKEKAQSSSICLTLRRSERLRVKENYRRCEQLWNDDGNRSQAGRNSMGSLSGRGSSCNQQKLKTSLDGEYYPVPSGISNIF